MLIAEIIFIAIMLLWGTPWTPDLGTLFKRSNVKVEQQNVIGTTSLETGGTDSGVIRKIVWKGAYDVWKNNPIIGTGLETFAHVYYQYRPAEHNLTSEWDYLYNKAHNEYLNYLATTGLLGFFAYIIFITTALLLIIKNIASDIRDQKNPLVHIALILGLLGVLITNFVGFSVVVSSIVIFLFPAMSECLRIEPDNSKLNNRYNFIQVFVVLLILLISIYSAFLITNYWRADIYYAKGRALNDQKLYDEAKLYLVKATNLYPNEPVYLNELAQSDSELAIKAFGEDRNSLAEKYATDAIIESETAVEMSPQNLNIRRSNAAIYIHLSDLDESLSSNVIQSIENSIQYSPTDAKLFYNLGLAYARVENTEKATETLNRAIDLKSDYRDARLALAIIYSQQGEKESAVKHLNYILEKINPEDKMTLQQLHEITGK
jgi:tetratricopeptide (TPR) repeat protein